MGETTAVRFGVLGPLEVLAGERDIAIPAGQMRTLLAALLVAAGRPVQADELAERLWPGRMPVSARGAVQTYIARLRVLLGHELIRTTPDGGYLVTADPEHVDLWRFRDLLDTARRSESAESELAALRAALGLWRSRPFLGVDSAWLDHQVIPALVEERFAAVERRIDLELDRADPGPVIPELRSLIANEPTRESLWLRLIEALHQSGRRVEALDAYQKVRSVLADEFGIDPGEPLQRVHRAILTDGVAPAGPPHPAGSIRQLPHDIAGFRGRPELDLLNRLVPVAESGGGNPTTIVAIDGAPGIGKTTLAVHWSHRMAPVYPDLQLYLNLRGFGPGGPVSPSAAAEALLRCLGVQNASIPAGIDERAALLRGVVAGRRTLLLLDDARDAEQVRPLLPGGDSLVVVTSRNQLRGLSIRDGAWRVTLDRLPADDALAMLAAVIGADRVAAEPEPAARVVELCDRLPLALSIVAERASRAGRLGDVVRALLDEKARLDVFGAGAADPHTDLRAALSWSYRALDADAAAMFRQLGLHPSNDIGIEAASALAGLPPRTARRTLDRLADAHLVHQRREGRFELHDLIRRYAAECAEQDDPAADREATLRRMLDWYLSGAVDADSVLSPHRCRDFLAPCRTSISIRRFGAAAEAIGWFEREFENLRAVIEWATGNGWARYAWRTAMASTTFFDASIPWHDGIAFYEAALRAAEAAGETVGEAFVLNSLGCIHLDSADGRQAAKRFQESLVRFRRVGHLRGEAMVLGNHGRTQAIMGNFARAERDVMRALHKYSVLGSRHGIAQNLDNLAASFAGAGNHRHAISAYLRADAIARELADTHMSAVIRHQVGNAYLALGEIRHAITAFRTAIAGFRELGIRRWEAFVLVDLGKAVRAAGHPCVAREILAAALRTLTRIADPRCAEIAAIIDDVGGYPSSAANGM